ncbi:Tfp pilus assembly protein PilN [Quadrisphaera granulorum]|uniref:Tfp pilus assembly protein PilN n=1 Tax=Quadrisphaera granulorum TaxID=317664 RepID=A0A315ZST7_9ACTN|nr:PilN domain-containing protein [Quadrisphaera granulorum]PWJ48000.1 Tfp pilus assembly protein PilN [Quadrisphaera granulorum]SZE98572.1 Tfp pilus assembly protein PilN [Quadrisphaera granulorum]
MTAPTEVLPLADDTVELPEQGFTGPGMRPARVNLLPQEVLAARSLLRTQRALGGGLAAVFVVLGCVYAGALLDGRDAADRLAAEQARTTSLQQQQAQFADVTATQNETKRLQGVQSQVMAGDVRWSNLLTAVNGSAPAGVWLTDISLTLADTATADGSAAAGADPLAEPAIATISVNGYATSQDGVAAWLDGLTALPGLADARYSTAQQTTLGSTPVVSFSSTVGVTPDALSHRFEKEAG